MAFKTFTSGAVLTAAEINTYLMQQAIIVCTSSTRPSAPVEGMRIAETDTDLEYIYSGSGWVQAGGFGVWTDYTPTLTQSAAVTKTVTYARYYRAGRMVTVQVLLAATGAGTGANLVTVSTPFTAAQAGSMANGSGYIFDASANLKYVGVAYLPTTGTVALQGTGTTTGGLGVTDFTAALASGDTVTVSFAFEAAS